MLNQVLNWVTGNLGLIVILLAFFGPVIANVLRAANKAKQKGRSGGEDDEPAVSRHEELAAQRRAELSGRGAQARTGGSDPSNLTMAERIARARAKAQYEQRSADLARGGGRTVADDVEIELVETTDPSDPFAREAEQAERRRREQQAELQRRREAERQQAAAEERRRREQAERARREATRRREAEQARAAEQSRRSSSSQSSRQTARGQSGRPSPTGRTRRRSNAAIADLDTDAISRGEVGTGKSALRLDDAGGRKSKGSGGQASVFGVRLTRRTMRHAIVLREVLDPPVALRPTGVGTPVDATQR
ncbi:MAG: hypothetical protein AAFY08_07940 [Planctomycetota bacterium]